MGLCHWDDKSGRAGAYAGNEGTDREGKARGDHHGRDQGGA